VIDDMILLDSGNRTQTGQSSQGIQSSAQPPKAEEPSQEPAKKRSSSKDDKPKLEKNEEKPIKEPQDKGVSAPVQSGSDEVNPDDIPF
jgi:hypothetical protein